MRNALMTVVTVICLHTILGVRDASACSCATPDSPCELVGSAQTVFIGTAIRREVSTVRRSARALDGRTQQFDESIVRFTFQVHEAINGSLTPDRTVVVSTAEDGAACGFPFQLGLRYLVHAAGPLQALATSQCTRTALESESRDVLDLMARTKQGTVVSELRGTVVQLQLAVDGSFAAPLSSTGAPGLTVLATNEAGKAFQTVADLQGRFLFKGLVPGRYTLSAIHRTGLRPAFDAPAVVEMNGCFATEPIFVTTEGIVGRVREADGMPVNGRQVRMTVVSLGASGHQPTRERSTFTSSESSGAFEFHGLPPGRYLLGVNVFSPPTVDSPYPPVWYPQAADATHATALTVDGLKPVRIEMTLPPPLKAIRYAGRVVDAAGRAVSRASVVLYAAGGGSDHVSSGSTDADGRFSLEGFPGSTYELQATAFASGLSSTSDRVAISADVPATVVLKPSERP